MIKNVLKFLCFFVCGLLLFSVTALAYVDPSAMTYMIQLIAGIVIAAGAALGFYFRRIRRALSRLGKKKNDRPDWQDEEMGSNDDGDDTGFAEYELDPAQPQPATGAAAPAMGAPVTAAPIAPTAASAAPAATPAAALSALLDAPPPADDRITPAVDEYDENGGEAGLLAENRELRRLLALERQKVELLKQSLHICTEPHK